MPDEKKTYLLHELYHLRNTLKILDEIACQCTTIEDIEATRETIIGILKAFIERVDSNDQIKNDLP